MSDVQVTTADRPRHIAKPADDDKPSRPLRVTGKLRTACDYLVYEGMPFDEAARKADLTIRAMRYALSRPHVIAYLRQQREILRESMCGANILVLGEVRDQTENHNARVRAVLAMEQIGEDNSLMRSNRSSVVTMPGLVIQIINAPDPQQQIVRSGDANPLISHDPDILHENVDR